MPQELRNQNFQLIESGLPKMNNETKSPVFASVAVVKTVLIGFAIILASFTILTQIAQKINLVYIYYALIGLLLTLGDIVLIVFLGKRFLSKITVTDRGVLALVLLAGVLGASLALVIRVPSGDDYYYVPNAVYYIQHPSQPMNYELHAVYSSGQPFTEIVTDTTLPYEYMQSVVAYFSGAEFLSIYYFLFTALAGFLIPLAYYYALSQFQEESNLENAMGIFLMIGVILLLGETPKTMGSFSFARAFEGKAVFLSLAPALFTGVTFDYLKKPGVFSWLSLFIVTVAMVGLSSTALVFLPALGSVLALVYLFSKTVSFRQSIRNLIVYFSGFGYIILVALLVRENAVSYHGIDSPQNNIWPVTFIGHLNFYIYPAMPTTPIMAAIGFVGSLIFSQQRKSLFLWVVFSILVYLNPLTAPFIIEHVTSPNIYWRMFYILPFPLLIGVAASGAFSYLRRFANAKNFTAAALACFLFVAALQIPLRQTSAIFGSDVSVGWPSYKLDPTTLKLARAVIAKAPPGVMWAPHDIGGVITMLNSNYPQVDTRDAGLLNWLGYQGRIKEANLRIRGSAFIEGGGQDINSFETIVQIEPDLKNIVLLTSVWQRKDVQAILNNYGYISHEDIGGQLTLVWRK